ncbi:hypothetical protein SAY87_006463 [Trapa incisa]|uniref:Uncharacterized protein n=1 Tax=Trapa incisa TaxID=236973 RepID=A0AAN7JY12_9MYRT|nr:hypothetical protein SAY87_006463 [Trapa incisa]
MFDGVREQLHHFIASRASWTSRLPLPPPPLSSVAFPFYHGFDPFQNPNPSLPPPHHQFHFLHHHPSTQLMHQKDAQEDHNVKNRLNFAIVGGARDTAAPDHGCPWTNEEVVVMLRIGSSTEHCSSTYRPLLVNELEDLYDHHLHHSTNPIPPLAAAPPPPQQPRIHHQVPHDDEIAERSVGEGDDVEEDKEGRPIVAEIDNMDELDSRAVEAAQPIEGQKRSAVDEMEKENTLARRKKKRQEKLETFKQFCERMAERLMAQQEEMQNTLLEDMMRR